MKKTVIVIIAIILGLSSCQNEEKKNIEEERDYIFSEIFSDSQLKSQYFEIKANRDTSLTSENGTIIKIYSNSFEINDSLEIADQIKIEIKEAYEPFDFVLGNLTTLSNTQLLVSGGMIYINATSNGQALSLKENSEIGFIVPTDSLDEQMMIYNGERDSTNLINWDSPEPIVNSKLRTLERSYVTIIYQHIGKFNTNDPDFSEWIWKPNRKVGDKTVVENVEVKIVDIAKDFVSLRESENGLFIPDVITNKGQNGFVEDFNTSYIFSVKKLGWANIDKLFNHPKSEEVKMLATIINEDEFGYVFTSLILPEEKMYIPGYQKSDNSFGFTHNDSEQLVLPVGAEAIIMATAYKDEKPYFNLKKIIIKPEMKFSFNLNETNVEDLKKMLDEKI